MLLGYCFGKLYQQGTDPAMEKKNIVANRSWLNFIIRHPAIYKRLWRPGTTGHQQPRGTVYTVLSF